MSFLKNDKIGSGFHPAALSMGTLGSFPGGGGAERPGRNADRSSQSNAKVKIEWSYTLTSTLCICGIH
jgi:hypothetical protein